MRCEARISNDYARSGLQLRGEQCRRVAGWRLDGHCFCNEHASLKLLVKCRTLGMIEELQKDSKEKEYRPKY